MRNDIVDKTGATLITRQDLLLDGLSSTAIQRQRKAGSMTVLRRGVYTPTGAFGALGLEYRHATRARAVALSAPGVVISHLSAAVLHLLPVRPAGLRKVHATRISTSGGTSDHARVIHIGRLAEDEIVEIDGTRTTSLARTLVDLARYESFEASVIAADTAFHLRPTIVDDVVEILSRSRRLRGHPTARQALLFADGRSESVGETRLRVFLRQIGLPPPELQCEVFGGRDDFLGRTDLAVLEAGALIEFDGMVKYGKAFNPHRTEMEVLRAEKVREESLWAAGWQVFRVVWPDLDRPEELEARLRTSMARGRRALAANPVIGSVRLSPPIRLPR
jgi:hypothetical protein